MGVKQETPTSGNQTVIESTEERSYTLLGYGLGVLLLTVGLILPLSARETAGLQPLEDNMMRSVTARQGLDLTFKINIDSTGPNPSDATFPALNIAWRDDDNLVTNDSVDVCTFSGDCSDAYGIFDEVSGHIHWDNLVIDATTVSNQPLIQLQMGPSDSVDGYLHADAIGLGPGTNPGCEIWSGCGNNVVGDVTMQGPFDIDGELRIWGDP